MGMSLGPGIKSCVLGLPRSLAAMLLVSDMEFTSPCSCKDYRKATGLSREEKAFSPNLEWTISETFPIKPH